MLKTALKPFWLAMLALALVASGVFVWLSKWQFESAETVAPPPRTQTENAVELTEHVRPFEPLLGTQADQIVSARGEFLPGTDVLVGPRLDEGEKGYWTVTAFAPADAPDGEIVPVVRGFAEDPSVSEPAPEGEVTVTGRILPPEGPQPRTRDEGADRAPQRLHYASLAPSQLTNVWDRPSYASFVAAFSVVDGAGEDVSVRAEPGGLEPVWVPPQPQETSIVWMNVFYGIEWIIFAGFALFLWWRFLRDDHQRELREAELDAQWEAQWRAEELARGRGAAARAKEQARAAAEAHRRRAGDD